MKIHYSFLILIAVLFLGCVSTPAPDTDIETPPIEEPKVVSEKPVVVEEEKPQTTSSPYADFDPSSISREQYEEEKSEIQLLVEQLNKITSTRDYKGWLNFISKEYRDYYSDPETLRAQTARLPVKNLKLNNLQDYFKFVFVVSRQKCRVDDINYMTPTRVKVIQKDVDKTLIIYNLEKFDGYWKIVLEL